jgi:hypothetical protein
VAEGGVDDNNVAGRIVLIVVSLYFGLAGSVLLSKDGERRAAFALGSPPVAASCATDCVTRARGLVTAVHGSTLHVESGDADVAIPFEPAASLPLEGKHVDIESWHGRVVSVYDRAAERRYHSRDWPRGPRRASAGVAELAGGVLLGLVALYVIVRQGRQILRIRATRRATAS